MTQDIAAHRPAVAISPAAQARIRLMLDRRGKPSVGIRLGVATKGCSGMSYTLEYADTAEPGDEALAMDGFLVLLAPKAMMFLVGTELDWVEEKMKSGFVFTNPNEAGRCGCGESFRI